MCGTLIYTTVLKLLFNSCARQGKDYQVPYDRWTVIDTFSAFVNLIGYPIIASMAPESMIDKSSKDMIDALMLFMIFM